MRNILFLIPSLRLIRLVALGAPLWLLALFIPAGWLAGLFYLALSAALCWRDCRTIPEPAQISARRELPHRFALGVDHTVELILRNRTALPIVALVRDELSDSFELRTDLPSVRIPGNGEAHLQYVVRPLKRGAHPFGAIVIRVQGQRGLMQRQMALAVDDTVKVYPNFRGADQYHLLAKIDQREEITRKPRPFKAAGTDFESLRPYISGEDPRNVDWKATARRGLLISRNRQVEKGQQLAVLLDAGRLMAETIGERSRLEHALDATVMLSYVAQKRGDALAAASFSNKLESFMPPVRGPSLLPRILESLYTVHARPVESDYWQVIAQVMAMLRRRSLIILLTDVLDATASAGLVHNLARAAERHLVLCVVLTEPLIGAIARSAPATVEDTYRKAAACDQLRRRWLALENMRSRGILVLETDPAHLSTHLVKRYLEIRQADLQ
ncbi:MAG TPA: DUF58 domain-containing protein [Candidatus Binatia bacterium]|jgi:uncharacterized protein (DUF58 family)